MGRSEPVGWEADFELIFRPTQASLDPWIDVSNRRYFLARTPQEVSCSSPFYRKSLAVETDLPSLLQIVGICILAPIAGGSYHIRNSIHFVRFAFASAAYQS